MGLHKAAQVGLGVIIWHQNLSNIGACQIGNGTIIHSHVWIGDKVIIGKRCRIQAFCFIPDGITIGDDVFIGPRVTFLNDLYPPSFGKHWKDTCVNHNTSIGGGVTILPGAHIGSGSIIGAGSLVVKSIPDQVLAYGNPAVVHKHLL